MKVQMVILANAREQRGRSLVGILLAEGRPVLRNGRPHWVRPLLRRDRHYIPMAMVVDLLPQDVIEFELLPGASVDELGGWVEMDPYSLKIIGKLTLDEVEACCWMAGAATLTEVADHDALDHELSLILACRCTVIHRVMGEEGEKPLIEMRFGYNGMEFQYPLTDPQFLETIEVEPNLLDRKHSVQLVLSAVQHRKSASENRRVLAVLV